MIVLYSFPYSKTVGTSTGMLSRHLRLDRRIDPDATEALVFFIDNLCNLLVCCKVCFYLVKEKERKKGEEEGEEKKK